jgi:carotenoid cleavage dioxygenase
MTTTVPSYLAGNYAPVTDELTSYDLQVTGVIPPELAGWYLRNGPNPHDAASSHWFVGDGMVHGVRLEAGRAMAYRNRWIRTKGGQQFDENGTRDLEVGVANTHVVRHAGRMFALVESSLPYELNTRPGCELDTVGPYDFGGKLTTAMTAHPKVCPATGELHFFGYGGPKPPFLTYHRADASGQLVISRPIEVPAATMMHDFTLTAGYVVFMDLPMVLDAELARRGGGMPYSWDENYGARLGVLRRDDPFGEVRWLPIDPCYVFHTMGAYDVGESIVLHVVRHPRLGDGVGLGDPGQLWRWTIDLAAGVVIEEQVDDRNCEFPRIDDRLAGLATRYGHATGTSPSGQAPVNTLLRYDLVTGDVACHDFGPGRTPAEASFIPADNRPGGPGWLISYVYDAATDRSDVVILDAEDLAAPPVAEIHLPRRVPFGFHGNWMPDELPTFG